MQNRNTKGQYSHKTSGKAVIWLIATFILIGAILIAIQEEEPTEAPVETSSFVQEQEAKLSPEVEEYMNSEEFKLEQELIARTRVLMKKRTAEQEQNKANLAQLKAEYEAKIAEENANYKAINDKIENELTDIRKNELELGAKSKSSLE